MEQPVNFKYITCAEAAKILGLSHDYIRRLAGEGKLNAFKVGHFWMMTEKDLRPLQRVRPKKDV